MKVKELIKGLQAIEHQDVEVLIGVESSYYDINDLEIWDGKSPETSHWTIYSGEMVSG